MEQVLLHPSSPIAPPSTTGDAEHEGTAVVNSEGRGDPCQSRTAPCQEPGQGCSAPRAQCRRLLPLLRPDAGERPLTSACILTERPRGISTKLQVI